MDIRNVALVIVEIGGYTVFIRLNRNSLAHAHQVIAQLLEQVTEHAAYPLVLNKF